MADRTPWIGENEAVVSWGPSFSATEGGTAILTLSSSLSQQHEVACEVTQHPVEDGVAVSDHVRKLPRTLQIAGVVSAWPISETAMSGSAWISNAWSLLCDMVGQAMSVSTSLQVYPRMVLRRMSVSREAKGGDDLLPQLELVELVTVSMATGLLPPEIVKRKQQKASAPGETAAGKQGTTDAATKGTTVAAGIDSLTGALKALRGLAGLP